MARASSRKITFATLTDIVGQLFPGELTAGRALAGLDCWCCVESFGGVVFPEGLITLENYALAYGFLIGHPKVFYLCFRH